MDHRSQDLFPAASKSGAHTAHVDGGARGNPGPAGYGVVIQDPTERKIAELSQYLGHHTNNYAEYSGLLAALRYAIAHQIHSLKIVSDSELMVRQMKGIYKVRHPDLRKLYDEAQHLTSQIEHVEIRHALREHNQDADRLANEAMDRGKGTTRTEPEPRIETDYTEKSNPRELANGDVAQRTTAPGAPAPRVAAPHREFEGIVRNGVIELLDGSLPEGTSVQIRPRR
jgi:probable phosphoglycerate mutase